jgi:excisionase family DNA binding protein
MSERQLLRKPDAAKLLAMSASTLEKLTARKQIPHVKLGRSVFYDTADLWAWIDSKKMDVCAGAPA